jgi:hypothetical protein
MSFLSVFSRVALFFSALSSVIGLFNVGLMFFALDPATFARPAYESGITLFMSQHIRVFVLVYFIFSVVGLVAAVALLKRHRWGLQTWSVLLALGIAWALVAAAIELLFPGPHLAANPGLGGSGIFRVLWTMLVPFISLVGALLLAWLLKKLLSPEVQKAFPRT